MHCTPKSFIQAHVCGRTATQCQPVVRFQRQTHILECSGLLATSCFLFHNISSQQNSIYFNGKEPYAILLLVLSRNHPVKNCFEFMNLTKDWFVICTLIFEPPFRILFPSGWVVFFHLGNFWGGLVNFLRGGRSIFFGWWVNDITAFFCASLLLSHVSLSSWGQQNVASVATNKIFGDKLLPKIYLWRTQIYEKYMWRTQKVAFYLKQPSETFEINSTGIVYFRMDLM